MKWRIFTTIIIKRILVKDGYEMYIIDSEYADNTIIYLHKLNKTCIICKSQGCKKPTISIKKVTELLVDFALFSCWILYQSIIKIACYKL